ncbi:glycosyltransferase family 4 protein [Variovorax sp. PBL-E5]|uniref:glycosyltransferase family 4 protein n=1 Tax=Variovorax sp. PBL-E5 TaxID=434014 RepID=UPI00131696B3|nr:glycosyltransferase family 4 protein [Variovorax sp. PBL-E5]VTU19000.1 D-inositol-3-phosphate glycosyltransferase [Variovorax sp. PBL-E5]
MKVLVVNNMAPFVSGGAEAMASHLQRQLQIAGHEAEVLRIPFQWEPATRIPSQMLMARAFEIPNVDHVIALKFPAYLAPHPRKTMWLVHQYRQAYDLYDAGQTNLPAGELGDDIRRLIRNADDECFRSAHRIFSISDVTQKRLAHYNGFRSEVLRAPINDPEIFVGGAADGYVFAGGRVNGAKRQHLLVEAMAHAAANVRLVVAGPPDTDADAERLRSTVERLGIQDRVRLDLRFLTRSEYADYVNRSSAVASLPFDEESFSYVAMEAATACKALISTTDSGGVLGLARDRETGWVAEPSAQALAQAMSAACANAARSREFGQAAHARWKSFGIDWPSTVQALLS